MNEEKIYLLESFLTTKPYEVLCLTETWITNIKAGLVNVSGYKFASAFYRNQHIHGGVAILLQEDIECIERNDIVNLSKEFIVECCCVEIPKYNVIIICIHRLDRDIEIFFDCLNKILEKVKLKEPKRQVVFGGDFNINALAKCKNTKRLLDLMLAYNLRQIVKDPTRVTNKSSTCIDLIFTNNTLFTVNVSEHGLSDHRGVTYSFNVKSNLRNSEGKPWITYTRIYNTQNIQTFKDKLQYINWTDILRDDQNINDNYIRFEAMLQLMLNEAMPTKRIIIKTKKQRSWITVGLKISCKHKRALRKLISSSQLKQNVVLNHYYKTYEKILKRSVYTSKRLNYKSEMQNSSNRAKTMWKIINEINGKSKLIKKNKITLRVNDQNIISPLQIANTFNDYFIGVYDEPLPSTSIVQSPKQKPSTTLPQTSRLENSMYLSPTNEFEVYNIINRLKNKKSYGIDEIPSDLLKKCAAELAQPLTRLINQSFEEGCFPESLKISIVKPIFKKGDKQNPGNYRPIALLSAISKIFEKAMSSRVYNFLEKNKIINDNQYGFRKNRSTVLAVYKYVQEALNTLNKKFYTVGIMLDLSKAYDKVCHQILLSKLYTSGIRGNAHSWFKSYLEKRTQYVQLENYNEKSHEVETIRSESRIMKGSIPQGSVLGCVLFLIYINELPNLIDTTCVLFADDISLLFKFNKNDNHDDKINETMCIIQNWMENQNLTINPNKTKLIQFYPYQRQPLNLHIKMDNIPIEEVHNCVLLGLNIDSQLNWKEHISATKTKLSRFLYALRTLKNNTDLTTAISAYYAYAEAWLRYGVILWGNSTDAHDLFVMQKKCIRILSTIPYRSSCKPYFIKLNILTLPSIYILEMATFVRKHPDFFTVKTKYLKYNLRSKNELALPTTTMEMYYKSPYCTAIKIYNKVPESLKSEPKLHTFIKKLKDCLIKKSYYTLDEFLTER